MVRRIIGEGRIREAATEISVPFGVTPSNARGLYGNVTVIDNLIHMAGGRPSAEPRPIRHRSAKFRAGGDIGRRSPNPRSAIIVIGFILGQNGSPGGGGGEVQLSQSSGAEFGGENLRAGAALRTSERPLLSCRTPDGRI